MKRSLPRWRKRQVPQPSAERRERKCRHHHRLRREGRLVSRSRPVIRDAREFAEGHRRQVVELKESLLTSDHSSILAIRSQFPVFERKVYLNSCSQGALSKRVEAAFGEYLRSWHEQVRRGISGLRNMRRRA